MVWWDHSKLLKLFFLFTEGAILLENLKTHAGKRSGHGYYCLVLLQAEWFLGGRRSCCCRGDQGAYGGQWTDWALEKTHWSHGITKFPHEVVDLTLSSYGTEGESSLMPSHRFFLTGFFQAGIDNHCKFWRLVWNLFDTIFRNFGCHGVLLLGFLNWEERLWHGRGTFRDAIWSQRFYLILTLKSHGWT